MAKLRSSKFYKLLRKLFGLNEKIGSFKEKKKIKRPISTLFSFRHVLLNHKQLGICTEQRQ